MAILGLVGYGLYILANYLFLISSTSCSFGEQSCPPPVLAELDRYQRTNLLTLDKAKLQSKILSSTPTIKDVKLDTSLPGKLHLDLVAADYLAQIATSSDSAVLIISDALSVVDYKQHPLDNLSLLISPQATQLSLGDSLNNTAYKPALSLINLLTKSYIPFTSIVLSNENTVQVKLNLGIAVYFDPHSDLQTQVRALQIILHQLPEEPVLSIDLRYAKPVIKFIN